MRKRSVIYFLLFALIAFLFYQSETANHAKLPPVISKEEILTDFQDLEDNDIPEGKLGGNFYVTHLYFPAGFQGQKGDVFYVSLEDGHIVITQYYIIQKEQDESEKLIYRVKDTWENFQPPDGKYETYVNNEGKWQKEV